MLASASSSSTSPFFCAPVDWLTGIISLNCPGDLRDVFPGRSSLNQRETSSLMCSPALQEGAQLKGTLARQRNAEKKAPFENEPTPPFLSPKNGLLCSLSGLPLTSGNRTVSIVLYVLEGHLKYWADKTMCNQMNDFAAHGQYISGFIVKMLFFWPLNWLKNKYIQIYGRHAMPELEHYIKGAAVLFVPLFFSWQCIKAVTPPDIKMSRFLLHSLAVCWTSP